MSSPFSIFRRHQKVLMVVVTGLSMISFVLLGMVSNFDNLPMPLMVLFLACVAGGVAALAGMRSGNASEWGVTGLLLGVMAGLIFMYFARQEDTAVFMNSGSLSKQQVSELRRQRYVANGFVNLTLQDVYGPQILGNPQFVRLLGLSQYTFGFGADSTSDDLPVNDIVVGEIFRRKGEAMGMKISDARVMEFINEISRSKMTRERFAEIRKLLQVSEVELMKSLKGEMLAKQVAGLTMGRNNITPETFWEFHRQLNVKQSAEVAAVPVDKFIDEQAVPPRTELEDLFQRYRNRLPGYDETGRPAPGAPGFYQPRRVQLAYFEANREALETTIPPVTDAEVEALFKARYEREMPGLEGLDKPAEGPALPPPPSGDARPAGDPPAPNLPAPMSENPPATGNANPPAAPENSAPVIPPANNPPAGEPMSALPISRDGLQPVSFLQETPPAGQNPPAPEGGAAGNVNPPVNPDPAAGAPGANPAAPPDGTPQNPPATDGADSGLPKLDMIPPAPTSNVPVLDESMKADLRQELHNNKVTDEVRKRVTAASAFMTEFTTKLLLPADNPSHAKLEDVTKQLEEYAQKHGLRYVVAPLMTLEELLKSEEHPVGQSITSLGTQSMQVVQSVYSSSSTDLYRPSIANLTTGSEMTSFAWWKVEDKAPFVPESLDNEEIKNQVTTAWRLTLAGPKAQARAEELAKLVRETPKSVPETLADVTITGKAGDVFVEVKPTGEFTWLQAGLAPATSMNSAPPVRESDVAGVTKPGEEFYKLACETLKEGETGVAPNADHTVYYVVKILARNPDNAEQLEQLRLAFLKEGEAPSYGQLAQQLLSSHSTNVLEKLFNADDVVIVPEVMPAGAPPAQ